MQRRLCVRVAGREPISLDADADSLARRRYREVERDPDAPFCEQVVPANPVAGSAGLVDGLERKIEELGVADARGVLACELSERRGPDARRLDIFGADALD